MIFRKKANDSMLTKVTFYSRTEPKKTIKAIRKLNYTNLTIRKA